MPPLSSLYTRYKPFLPLTAGVIFLLVICSGLAFGLHYHPVKQLSEKPNTGTSTNQDAKSGSSSSVPSQSSTSGTTPSSGTATSQQKTPTTSSTSHTAPSVSQNTPAAIPSPKSCVKDTSYQPAQALTISTSSPGLKQVVDTPRYYEVYGYTAAQIRTQLNQCFPSAVNGFGDVDAVTTTAVNFAFTVYSKPSGQCALTDVTVGAHVAFLFPTWTNTAYAAPGLNSQWQTYVSNLPTHHNGHRDTAITYATTLYNSLVSYPDTDCSTIDQAAKNYGNNLLGIMYLAQATYDAQNHHGATQGATFP